MKATLLKYCASDLDVVNAARVSFGKRSEELTEGDEKLIKYLLKNNHGTPFEHGYFQYHIDAPIFVFREWHRHRVGHSYNEMSGRYVELEDEFYWPDVFRMQVGKPGAYQFIPMDSDFPADNCLDIMSEAYGTAWRSYKALLDKGIAKEQARVVLPLGTYSQMYWSCNPRSLMHFVGLRNKADAQEEIRVLAASVLEDFKKIMPITASAWADLSK